MGCARITDGNVTTAVAEIHWALTQGLCDDTMTKKKASGKRQSASGHIGFSNTVNKFQVRDGDETTLSTHDNFSHAEDEAPRRWLAFRHSQQKDAIGLNKATAVTRAIIAERRSNLHLLLHLQRTKPVRRSTPYCATLALPAIPAVLAACRFKATFVTRVGTELLD